MFYNDDIEKAIDKELSKTDQWSDSWFNSKEANELRKIGQLCEVCLDFLPKKLKNFLRNDINNCSIYEVLIKNFIGYFYLICNVSDTKYYPDIVGNMINSG